VGINIFVHTVFVLQNQFVCFFINFSSFAAKKMAAFFLSAAANKISDRLYLNLPQQVQALQ
jgi:hypothetical protein